MLIVFFAVPLNWTSLVKKITQTNEIDQKKLIKNCVDEYVKAADLYISIKAMSSRVCLILDRIEFLKTLLISSYTEVEVIENLLPEVPLYKTATSSTSENTTLSNPPEAKVIDKNWIGANNKLKNQRPLKSILPNDHFSMGLSETEIDVLRASSVVNNLIYQPWLPGEEEREKFRFDHLYCDPDGLLPLSPKQIEKNAVWKRPSEFLCFKDIGGSDGTAAEEGNGAPQTEHKTIKMIADTISPLSIRQDLITDCSFVCSLCIASAFEMKFRKQLITAIIFPQNSKRMPIYNAYGKYLVKLHINGVPRKVVVDDRLPVSADSGDLLCSTSTNGGELWVSIIEKAYMKVNGGYSFPGSNSGIDLYALTGWIPEQVFFSESSGAGAAPADHTQQAERAWKRLQSAHGYGDCLITVSTGELSAEQEAATGLVPSHAYAVLDVREAGTLRLLKVKNPWSKRPWKGRFSCRALDSWTDGLHRALGCSVADLKAMDAQGLFWIEFGDCRTFFKSFFLNWNPALFSYRTVVHDFWPAAQGPPNDKFFIGRPREPLDRRRATRSGCCSRDTWRAERRLRQSRPSSHCTCSDTPRTPPSVASTPPARPSSQGSTPTTPTRWSGST